MKPTPPASQDILSQLEEAMALYFRIISGNRYQVECGEVLTPAELHMISLVATLGNTHVTQIAQQTLVTKGAVSQLLSKLEKKGFIQKTSDATHGSRVIVRTSPLGSAAAQEHKQFHEKQNAKMLRYLDSCSPEEKKAILGFTTQIITWLEGFHVAAQ